MVAAWPAAVAAGWHPVAFAHDVGPRRPAMARLMGCPLLVIRDAEGVYVIEDRYPHRGVPLSRGRVRPPSPRSRSRAVVA